MRILLATNSWLKLRSYKPPVKNEAVGSNLFRMNWKQNKPPRDLFEEKIKSSQLQKKQRFSNFIGIFYWISFQVITYDITRLWNHYFAIRNNFIVTPKIIIYARTAISVDVANQCETFDLRKIRPTFHLIVATAKRIRKVEKDLENVCKNLNKKWSHM